MNRLTFLQMTFALSGMAPYLIDKQTTTEISEALLLGKGNPELVAPSTPLLKEVHQAFIQMKEKAAMDGIAIEIVSAYRSYDRQKAIWNRKFSANQKAGLSPTQNILKIIEYSTLPGTSRHHWGTDIDVIDGNAPREGDVLLTEKFYGKGPYSALRKWMEKHAADFGFLLPYTNNPERKGFYYEPWHYSYAPISKKYLNDYLKLDLNVVLKTTGLLGKEALDAAFIKKYIKENVLGISSKLL